jgi:phage terminase small subunit
MARKKAAPRAEGEPDPLEGLTWQQRKFVVAYLGVANGNATEAARIAGYAHPNVQGSQQLVKLSIRAAIAAKLENTALPVDEVLGRLSDMASVDMGDFVAVSEAGFTLALPKAKKARKLHLVKKLTHTKYGVSIELHDAQAALEKLGRYHGLFKDLHETKNETTVILDPDSRAALDRGYGESSDYPNPPHDARDPGAAPAAT